MRYGGGTSKVKMMMDSTALESTAESDELRMSGLKKEKTSEINAFQNEEKALDVETKQVSRNLYARPTLKKSLSIKRYRLSRARMKV
jgi:hypothetical protein